MQLIPATSDDLADGECPFCQKPVTILTNDIGLHPMESVYAHCPSCHEEVLITPVISYQIDFPDD